jgi:hypothetical protein
MTAAVRFDLSLARHMVEHVHHRDPSPTITAPHPELRMYSARADANRIAYFAQSEATKGGIVAPFKPIA